jgi:uncharacterized membrane protein YjjP (DUF1212 family)
VATANEISSKSFTNLCEALGSSYAGDIIINGNMISISESNDIADVQVKRNNASSGLNPNVVTARSQITGQATIDLFSGVTGMEQKESFS